MSCETKAAIYEDSPVVVLARITGEDGDPVTQGTLSAITCRVYTYSGTLVVSPAVTVASSVFDTLQTEDDDARWTGDAVGYNFAFTIPAAAFPDPGLYRAEFKFTPSTGDPFFFVVTVHASSLFQS